MQTILGSGGVIGNELAKSLPTYDQSIRLVARNPKKVNANDQLVKADLTDPKAVDLAVEGSDVAYLTVGLKYDRKIWAEQWPRIMDNAISACKKHNTKLVFFDNVYPYGQVDGWMTEDTPYNPSSRKGEIRTQIATRLMEEVKKGELKALIARSADFYGPNASLSVVNMLVFENLIAGKKMQWLGNAKALHSLTYTPDAGAATARLGNDETAFNQVWHLPTDRNVLTGVELMTLFALAYDVPLKYTELNKFMLQLAGVFNPTIKESIEMLYQSAADYLFDSSKYDKKYKSYASTYAQGVNEMVAAVKSTG